MNPDRHTTCTRVWAMQQTPDVSVIVPFADDEDLIGTAVRRLAAHLTEQELGFEIIAVDEDSGDNSHAVLALLRPHLPELRISNAPGRGRGFACGAQRARGKLLWLIEPAAAARSALAPFGRAYRRVLRGEQDMVSVSHRFVVARRTHALPAIDGLRGSGWGFQRRLVKRAVARHLAVDQQIIGGAARPITGERAFSRLLSAFALQRLSSRSSRSLW